jgi:hypothetical protein
VPVHFYPLSGISFLIPKLLPCREPPRGLRSEVRSVVLSTYALKGEAERAAAELAESRRLAEDDRYSSIACVKSRSTWGVSKTRALLETTYFAGLRKAGMPEE